MQLTRTTTLRALKIISVAAIIGLIIAYAIWRSFSYVQGPKIIIFTPENGSSTASSTATIRGRAERTTGLSLNGNTISVDEQGNWDQTLIVFPGDNIISIKASDRFGRSISQTLSIVGLH